MSRIRSITPESCLSETLAEMSDRACLLFAYLPCFCDDEGRMQYSPRLVKAQVFPLRDQITPEDCGALVDELAARGLVIVYEAGGKRILQITNFLEHQHPQKPKPSEFPPPDGYGSDAAGDGEPADGGAGRGVSPENATDTVVVADEYGSDTACRVVGEEGNRRVIGEEKEKEKEKAPRGGFRAEDARRVVAYLNRKTGKSFKHSTSKTQRNIRARFREGFTVDDFKRVIDVKCAQWGGDRKMAGYLRPETLFGPKFEGYLNEWTPEAAQGAGRYAKYN